jgi:hypothetical protein
MKGDFIPKPEAQFHNWQNILMTYFAGYYSTWGVPPVAWTELCSSQADYNTKYAAAENPATRTSVAVLARQEARQTYETRLRSVLKAFVTYNPAVTDEDRRNMGLPIHKTTHTPAPVAATYPDFDVDSSVIRRLTIHFYDQGSKSKAKPEGQHGAEITWGISETPIVNVADFTHSSFDTRSPFTLEFTGEQRGKTVYFCLRWENTRGEKGPWSEIVSAIVP